MVQNHKDRSGVLEFLAFAAMIVLLYSYISQSDKLSAMVAFKLYSMPCNYPVWAKKKGFLTLELILTENNKSKPFNKANCTGGVT